MSNKKYSETKRGQYSRIPRTKQSPKYNKTCRDKSGYIMEHVHALGMNIYYNKEAYQIINTVSERDKNIVKIVDNYLWEYPTMSDEFKKYIIKNNNIGYQLIRSKYIELAEKHNCLKLLNPEQCDNTRSDNRLKSIIKYVINRQPAEQNKIRPTCYLDIGCFDGSITHAIGQYFNLHRLQTHGVDIKNYNNSNNITFSLYDGKNLPYSDSSFDLITCLMVLHHIPAENLKLLISEISRVMKPNGVVILREHNVNNDSEKLLLDLMHDFYDYVWKDNSTPNNPEEKSSPQWTTNYNSHIKWTDIFADAGFNVYTPPNIFQDEKRNPFVSYLCSYYKPSAINSSIGTDIFRVIPDNLPRETYKRRTKEIKTVLHWGQRKLLLTEIEFFTLFMEKLKTDTYSEIINNNSKKIYAIYAGSAPGTHILYLAKLFPMIHFELYDPREFSKKLIKNREMINTYVQYFTDDTAQQWISTNHPDKLILLISDIRTGEPEKQSPEMVEERVKIDHIWQKNWYNIMKPEMAMFKFRLPWNDEMTEYLDGDIYIQPYPPATSTETRLIIGKNAGTKLYDNRKYEEQFFYFNNHIRPTSFNNLLYNIPPEQKNGISNNYDSATEVYILENYIKMKSPEYRHISYRQSGKPPAKQHVLEKKIIKMIKQISSELSNVRTMYSKQPVKEHKKNILLRLQQLNYIPQGIELDQSAFDIYVIPRYDFFKDNNLID